ncbi:MAG: glycosyltransferase [Pseudomonadota bacterium]
MRIVDVAEFYAPHGGGVKTYLHQKLEAAAAAGHELVIIAPGPRTYMEERAGGRIWWVKAVQLPFDKRYYLFAKAAGVHAILDREQPDVIEASSTWRGAWIVAHWPGRAVSSLVLHQEPVSVYPHTLFDRFIAPRRLDAFFARFWRYLRALQAHYDTSVVSGAWLADRFASFGCQRPFIAPFGIDKSAFSPRLRDPALRANILRSMDLDPNQAKLLVNVSRHHPEKRLPTVFDAIKRVNSHRPVGLLQIGSGPFSNAIQRKARHNPYVSLHGFVEQRSEIAKLLASGDAMIHGGAAETFGLVVAEGLCSGLPLIVPDRGGALDMVQPAYGQVYKTGDTGSAAVAVNTLLDRDGPYVRRAVRQAVAQSIHAHWEHFEQLFGHYEDLCLQRGLPQPLRQRPAA